MSFLDSQRIPAKNPVRAFVGAAASSAFLPASALAAFTLMFYYGPSSGEVIAIALANFLFAFLASFVIIAVAGLVVGLPLTWILSSNRLEQPWIYPLAGFVSGGLIALLLVVIFEGAYVAKQLPFALFGVIPGCLFGAIWWHCHRRHLQDA